MKKAFISGISGQDGAYLAQLLISKGYHVTGGLRRSSINSLDRLEVLGIVDALELVRFDLTDPHNIINVVSNGQYDEFYNLAAQSFVAASWDFPIQTADVDAMGVLRILEAIKNSSPHTKFYQASTSEMFGKFRKGKQSESTPFYPNSPYGVSKLFGHSMTLNYRESFNIHASSAILFNHESPLRGPEFVTKKITSTLVKIALGLKETLYVGNISARRDWGYAAEYVEGMWQMLQQDNPNDYVLATGVTTSVKEFIEFSANSLGIQIEWSGSGVETVGICKERNRPVIVVDPKFFRRAEIDVFQGDPSKAAEILNWKATTTVQQLCDKMVKYDYDLTKKLNKC